MKIIMERIFDKKTELPLVSIIIPIYGVEQYLRECVDSVLKQTYTNIEIILVDDGSKDQCPQICDEYAKKEHRVFVVHKENGGLVSARKEGLKVAKGKYIQFVDGDDWIHCEMTEKLVQCANVYNVDVVTCGLMYDMKGADYKIRLDHFSEGYYDTQAYEMEIVPRILCTGTYYEYGIFTSLCNKLFKKEELITHIMNVDERITIGEDAAALYPYLLSIKSMYILHDIFYYYRTNLNSITKSYNAVQIESTIILCNYLYEQFRCFTDVYPNIVNQLDYYKLFVTEWNLLNEARAGFSMHFFARWRNMKRFINTMKIKDIFSKTNFLSGAKRQKWMLKVAVSKFLYLLMFYQAIKHGR